MESEVGRVQFVTSRRAGREAAMKAMYEATVGRVAIEQAVEDVLSHQVFAPELARFVRELALGVHAAAPEIDRALGGYIAANWRMSRLALTDKLALRIAYFELFQMPEIPPKVSIDEAVRLAKRFGGPDSGKFVNGVLGKLLPDSPKANWRPVDARQAEEPEPEEPEPEPPEETVEEGSEEHKSLKAGTWTLRREEP